MSPAAQRSQSNPPPVERPLNLAELQTEQFFELHWFRQMHWHCVASLLGVTVMAWSLQSVLGEHVRHDGRMVPKGHMLQSAPL